MNATTQDLLRARAEDRARKEGEMIPRGLLIAMFALVLSSLALVSFAVLSGRAHVGQPAASAIVAEKEIVLEGHGAKAVTVRAPDGRLLFEMAHGGFVAVIQNGLERARFVAGADQSAPVRLAAFANGRLAIIDPETGWSVELGSFGSDNKAAFERLMTN